MSEPEQNQKSENRHASFSDLKDLILNAARDMAGEVRKDRPTKMPDIEYWSLCGHAVSAIRSILPELEKHFRHKFGNEPEQNQKSENRHASFSDELLLVKVTASMLLWGSRPESHGDAIERAKTIIKTAWPDLEKHFRQKLEDERIKEMIESGIIEYYKSSDSLFPKLNPQATDTISNKINALACALREVEKTVPKAQARYKTQSDDTKESILKALSVLAFEARKECRPSQVVSAEKPTQKYPDAYYDLDNIANRITFKAQLYPNLSFSELQKEIRADLNVLEEKL
jgi:hypothetical protein